MGIFVAIIVVKRYIASTHSLSMSVEDSTTGDSSVHVCWWIGNRCGYYMRYSYHPCKVTVNYFFCLLFSSVL